MTKKRLLVEMDDALADVLKNSGQITILEFRDTSPRDEGGGKPYSVFYSDEDPNAAADDESAMHADHAGWYYEIHGQEGANGPYEHRTDAERAAIEELGL